jgi:hypothetical protein
MSSVPVNVAVEGISDEAVARRLLATCDLAVGTVHIQNGKGRLDQKLPAFGVPANKIAGDPDQVSNPKTELVNLARKSRKKAIRDDMVPMPNSTAVVGPAYGTRIIEFATLIWNPTEGAEASRSLKRCIAALQRLALET